MIEDIADYLFGGLYLLAGEAASETEYKLTGKLLKMAVHGEKKYTASGNDYAANLVQSDSGFVNVVKRQYQDSGKIADTGLEYEFPLSNGDLGAALHKVRYSYCLLPGEPGKPDYLYVTVIDTFDFTEWENPFKGDSLWEIVLFLANDAAYIDSKLGILEPVEVEIIVEIYP